jgi:hypothetical protein
LELKQKSGIATKKCMGDLGDKGHKGYRVYIVDKVHGK